METRTRKFISDIDRKAIFSAWGNICAYCENNPAEVVDHIVPFSKGGPCELENFAASCTRCNLRKTNNSLAEGYIQIILAIAANRAEKIRKAIASAQKPKQVKVIKPSKPKKADWSGYIKASSQCDWTDVNSDILKQFNAVGDAIYVFTIDNEKMLEPLYAFNIVIKQGKHRFTPFLGLTYHPDTKRAELEISAKGIPFLHICAEKMIEANEIIFI